MAETYQGNDFDYTGLHAFVFIDGVDPGRNAADVVEALGGAEGREFPNGRVLFASVTVGAHKGFAHVRADEGDLGRCSGSSTRTCGPRACAASTPSRGPSTRARAPTR